jgi:hypothetical protein
LFSFGIALVILSFLAPSYDLQPVASFPIAACNTLDDEPPDAVIFLQKPLSGGNDDACALWEAAADFDRFSLPVQAAPSDPSQAPSECCFGPIPRNLLKLLISTPRSPPLFL